MGNLHVGGRAAFSPSRTQMFRMTMMAGCAAVTVGMFATSAVAQSVPPGDQTNVPAQDSTSATTTAPATTNLPTVARDKGTDEIVVTGSRLAQKKVTDLPIAILSGQTIEDEGYTNIGQALTNSPNFGVPGNSTVGGQGSYGAGQTFVNMFDLGAQRTLVLVNGNRFVSSATSSLYGAVQGSPVDLGQIAPGLVDRIDEVSVGGAPIYGSDAIAG